MRERERKFWARATHVNGWEPAVYMSYTSQNLRFFHASNLSVRNFRICMLMYQGSVGSDGADCRAGPEMNAGRGRPNGEKWSLRSVPELASSSSLVEAGSWRFGGVVTSCTGRGVADWEFVLSNYVR